MAGYFGAMHGKKRFGRPPEVFAGYMAYTQAIFVGRIAGAALLALGVSPNWDWSVEPPTNHFVVSVVMT
jgi:hypothetical protein